MNYYSVVKKRMVKGTKIAFSAFKKFDDRTFVTYFIADEDGMVHTSQYDYSMVKSIVTVEQFTNAMNKEKNQYEVFEQFK
jgi:hypothetical protein